MKRSSRYLIMAGGTGGHIFPAMAVAKALRERGGEVSWLGTPTGMEQRIVPKENIPYHHIAIKGFRGKGLLTKLMTPLVLVVAVLQAVMVIVKVRPQVVVGFGGYVSAPGGIAARLLAKPLIIHEQNSVAGSTNKLLAKLTNYVLEAFPGSLPRAMLVGNPVRDEVKQLMANQDSQAQNNQQRDENQKMDPEKKFNVLITGGSLGAQAINELMPAVIEQLPEASRPNVWHQTGQGKIETVLLEYERLGIEAKVEEFIQQVDTAYAWADIIICRAGALTVSEVAVAGVPAIFIPYPYAIDNHQSANAKWLVQSHAALLIEQSDLSVPAMVALLGGLLERPDSLRVMSEQCQQVAMPNATEDVVAICEQVSEKGGRHAA